MKPAYTKSSMSFFSFTSLCFMGALIAFLNLSCESKEKTYKKANWNRDMKTLAAEITELLPYVYNEQKFTDPRQGKKLRSLVHSFSESVHQIPKKQGEKILGNDPLVINALEELEKSTKEALVSFDAGHYKYSRYLLKSSLNHCFRCHSRSGGGPEYTYWNIDFDSINVSTMDKTRILIATRQYDRAIEWLESRITQMAQMGQTSYDQELAIKAYLAIMVRVKRDPKKAHQFLQTYLTYKGIPIYLFENAKFWEKSLKDWMIHDASPKDRLLQAQKLVKKGFKKRKFQTLDSGNIEYLRASALLHDELAQTTKKRKRAQIYSLLGESYDVLSDLGFWDLPEIYYEMCIRQWPKSSLAKKCFRNYEKNIILGFSGSSGMFIPKFEQEKLDQLKKMAIH